jgi:uncharacterized integral membrane protein
MSSHRSEPSDRELDPALVERPATDREMTNPDAPPAEPKETVPAHPPRTRVSTAFNGFTVGAVLLLLLLIFILENTKSVKISFLGAGGHIALGVALLLAAVGGALVVGVFGMARIGQVRRHAVRRGRARGR